MWYIGHYRFEPENPSFELQEALESGWEPFSITQHFNPEKTGPGFVVWLKKEITNE